MPEIADALHAALRGNHRRARKLGVLLASGIAVTAVAGTLVYPYASHGRAERVDPPAVIVETAISELSVKAELEMLVTAPPLVEAPALRATRPAVAHRPALVQASEEPAAIPLPEPVAPAVVAEAPKPPPAAAAPPPVDRFDGLRTALAGCGARGLFDRAVCEQQARLEHCAGYWGNAPLCPSGRYDHTQ